MDFGYPQISEAKILREYITQEAHKMAEAAKPPMAVTNAVSWRSEGIKHRKSAQPDARCLGSPASAGVPASPAAVATVAAADAFAPRRHPLPLAPRPLA